MERMTDNINCDDEILLNIDSTNCEMGDTYKSDKNITLIKHVVSVIDCKIRINIELTGLCLKRTNKANEVPRNVSLNVSQALCVLGVLGYQEDDIDMDAMVCGEGADIQRISGIEGNLELKAPLDNDKKSDYSAEVIYSLTLTQTNSLEIKRQPMQNSAESHILSQQAEELNHTHTAAHSSHSDSHIVGHTNITSKVVPRVDYTDINDKIVKLEYESVPDGVDPMPMVWYSQNTDIQCKTEVTDEYNYGIANYPIADNIGCAEVTDEYNYGITDCHTADIIRYTEVTDGYRAAHYYPSDVDDNKESHNYALEKKEFITECKVRLVDLFPTHRDTSEMLSTLTPGIEPSLSDNKDTFLERNDYEDVDASSNVSDNDAIDVTNDDEDTDTHMGVRNSREHKAYTRGNSRYSSTVVDMATIHPVICNMLSTPDTSLKKSMCANEVVHDYTLEKREEPQTHPVPTPRPTSSTPRPTSSTSRPTSSNGTSRHGSETYTETHTAGETLYHCPICPRQYTNKQHLQQHMTKGHCSVTQLSCSVCDISFTNRSLLTVHKEDQHGVIPERSHKCNVCGVSFTDKSNRNRHQKTHGGNPKKRFACSMCAYRCTKSQTLNIHERIHTGVKPFMCSVCAYTCSTKAILNKHMRVHSNNRPFHCTQCTLTFKSTFGRSLHVKTKHSEVRDYKCTQCKFTCVQLPELKRHIRVHTGEKPYSCKHCTYTCAQQGTMSRHMRTHRRQTPFKCCVCEYEGTTAIHLLEHMNAHRRK